ncbi:MAG: NF038143 family protein [Desulfovermiculus sp.]
MSKILDKVYKLLLERERRFAKNVAYLIRAQTQRPWWHIFIPFKFLLEYRDLKKDIRNFSAKHVHLKQIALSTAYRTALTHDREKNQQAMQAELRDFCLHTQKIASQEAYELLKQWMDLLFQHYLRLFEQQERDYSTLIRRTYTSSEEYRSFLDQLNTLEQRIDQAILSAVQERIEPPEGRPTEGQGTDPYIRHKQKAIQDLRARELNDIFPL